MHLTKLITATALMFSTALTATAASTPQDMGYQATYEVTFIPSWNPATHPMDYPLSHAKHGLLTPIIGATHNQAYTLFAKGQKPTPGLERLSEMGMHAPLDQEIQNAKRAGSVGALVRFEQPSPGPVHPTVRAMFQIDEAHPMVSLVGMIAPSPDWFYGVGSVSLRDGSAWVASRSVTVYAWDSGGDAGASYMAEDSDLASKEATKPLTHANFKHGGVRVPVGTFVFKRVPDPAR